MKTKIHTLPTFVLILATFVIIAAVIISISSDTKTSAQPVDKLTQFALCLKDKKAILYGAFWCSHCQNQKKIFGVGESSLPYVECSTPDGNGQLEVCTQAKITGYPTWVFADGSTVSGEITLETLATKTGCQQL